MRLRLRRRSRRPQQPGGLRITSMMDILTVLLLFLLKSFVAEGEVVTPAPGVTLPESRSQDTPRASLVIAIAADHIRLGDEVITRLDGSVDGGLGPGLYIDRLGAELERVRHQQQSPRRTTRPRRGLRRQGHHPGRSRPEFRRAAACDVHLQREWLSGRGAGGDPRMNALPARGGPR
jgi:hypothetical protein